MPINSNDSTGAAGAIYAHLLIRVTEHAVKQGIEAGMSMGVKAAIEYMEKGKKEAVNKIRDRRLHNTRLLLQNYRRFKQYTEGAVYNAKQAKERAIDILEGLDNAGFDDDLYVDSIKKSQQRTLIILRHVDEMLRYYRIDCERSGRPEDMRRYRVIMAHYIDDEKKSPAEICEQENIEKRTIYKDIGIAIGPLTALLFGIDSIKLV